MPITPPFLPTVATVDLTALTHNLSQFRRILSPGCEVMAVVKANAYGHGAIETSRTLIQYGVTRLAVFSTEEGMALRQAGITVPIVVLGPVFQEQFGDMFASHLTPVVSDPSMLTALAQAAASRAIPYPIHLKIETGMGRLGLTQDELVALIRSHKLPPSLRVEGLMTHLADADGSNSDATEEQIRRFRDALKIVQEGGFHVSLIHASNSCGAVRFPSAHFSLVRPGIMLYGYHTLPSTVEAPDLRPVLSLKTHIAQLRTIQPGETVSYNRTFTARRLTRIAVLPIGYANGMSRRLSNRGSVLIRGQRAPIAGLVCMDMVMVDVTEISGTAVGDETVLIGRQGNDEITASEIAKWTDTIPYEVLCAISPKIPRRYLSP
ncbi:MAG: alanine racemase [Nitrospira sp. CG24B]|nr:MAG: alanine racemase [Nitrospira sp. CG24B]